MGRKRGKRTRKGKKGGKKGKKEGKKGEKKVKRNEGRERKEMESRPLLFYVLVIVCKIMTWGHFFYGSARKIAAKNITNLLQSVRKF